jgi:hypothetical protein
MTKSSTFKKKIRARMKKTGERYAAARQALLSESRGPAPRRGPALLPGYELVPGVHNDSARLRAALAASGVIDPATGEAFSEAKLFGLGGGVGFMYFLFEYKGHPPTMTFTCGSWSMPGPVLERALKHAGVEATLSQTGSAKIAQQALDDALDAERPAHVTVDFATLPWSGAEELWRGQMPRQANVVGYDGDEYLLDDGAPFVVERQLLADARAAARKEKNRLVSFSDGAATRDPVDAVRAAIAFTARNYDDAPVKGFAGNFGLRGLEKLATAMSGRRDKKAWSRVFATSELAFVALQRTWECAMVDYTAPAGGRAFYADFLEEASALPGLSGLTDVAVIARDSGARFERLADDVLELGGAPLARAIELTEDIDDVRRTGAEDAGERVRGLRAERDALAAQLELDEAARADVFDRLGERVREIHEAEGRLASSLAQAVGA